MTETFHWQPQRQDIGHAHRISGIISQGKIPWNGRTLWSIRRRFGQTKPVEDYGLMLYLFDMYYNWSWSIKAGNDTWIIWQPSDPNERLYVGGDGPFNSFTFNIDATTYNFTSGSATWHYWNGAEQPLVTTQNDFSDLSTVGNGPATVSFNAPSDWAKSVIAGSEFYWVWSTYTGRVGDGLVADSIAFSNATVYTETTSLNKQRTLTYRYLFDLTSDEKSATKFVDDLKAFYVARKGQYESFYLPSWREESQLSSDVSAGSNVITVDKPEIFSLTSGEHGNRIFLLDSSWTNWDVKSISDISGNDLTLDANLSNAYTAKTPVHHCYEVTFSNPTWKEEYLIGNVYFVTVNFAEVL